MQQDYLLINRVKNNYFHQVGQHFQKKNTPMFNTMKLKCDTMRLEAPVKIKRRTSVLPHLAF